MKKIFFVFMFLTLLLQCNPIMAQDLLGSTDLSAIKVDNLSSSDIARIKTQLQSNNLSLDQAEPLVLAKGMSKSEFTKLRLRLESTSINAGGGMANSGGGTSDKETTRQQ